MATPRVLKPFYKALMEFIEEGAPQSAAALSFYAVMAIPPLVVVLTAILSIVYSGPQAASELVVQVTALFGESTGETIAAILERRSKAPNGTAAITGSLVLLLGASGFFTQLQAALNQVWGVEPKPETVWKMLVGKRLISMTAVLGTGFLLLVSLVLSALLSAASDWVTERLGWSVSFAAFSEAFLALALLTGLFAFIFKVLPDVKVGWGDVWRGAVTTSLLFLVGKFALGWYLGRTDLAADYGSAGALVLILFWVYYTSLILLFGAELTQAQAEARGHIVLPERYAERVKKVRESDANTDPAFIFPPSRNTAVQAQPQPEPA